MADWSVAKIRKMVKAIVGFELKVERWEGKKKVGQNRSAEDQASLKRNLENSGDPAYQMLAKKNENKLACPKTKTSWL